MMDNVQTQENFDKIHAYITALTLPNKTPLVASSRRTGFVGILIPLKSVILMFEKFINTTDSLLRFLPMYKLSQDHIKLFFGTIRSRGHDDNPTCSQLTTAYKKILIHSEVWEHGMGNCLPLDQVHILSCTERPAEDLINDTNVIYQHTELSTFNESLIGHDYAYQTNLSEYAQHVTIYTAGFTVSKLASKIRCEMCTQAITGVKENLLQTFISLKDKGGLTYPSSDVIATCKGTELLIQRYLKLDLIEKKQSKVKIVLAVLKKFFGVVFVFLNVKHNMSAVNNHELLLIRTVTEQIRP
jgi:hypothetical protein